MVGTAVKVTDVPSHIGPEGLALIATDATAVVPTAMVMVLEVAGDPVVHNKLDVIIQVTALLFINAEEE